MSLSSTTAAWIAIGAACVAVVALALPVFLIAGWPVRGWALGAVLWAASQLLGLLFNRVGIGEPNLRGSGVVAFDPVVGRIRC